MTTVARATGVCLVVHSYLSGLWLDRHAQSSPLVDWTREWLNRPLGIGEDFGVLGLMLLLLASGYTSASSGFDVPRLVRIAVPLGVGGALTVLFGLLGADVLVEPLVWVVGIELVVWLTGALALRTRAWVVPLVQLLVAAGALLAGGLSPWFAVLFPLAVLGQVFGDHRLPGWAATLFGFAAWGLLAWTEHVHPSTAQWWYPLTALIAVLLFLVTLRANDSGAAVAWLARRSRSILVLVGGLGWAVLGLGLPFPIGFLVALGAVVLAAELPHRLHQARTSEVPR